jgi:hypothetical protein
MCGSRYQAFITHYAPLTLEQERQLIASAQRGSPSSTEELILRHIGFVSFRIHRRVFPHLLRRFGEELLAETILVLYAKIQTYDLDYRDKTGQLKPVKFVTYIWKRIDGHIVDSIMRELKNDRKMVGGMDDLPEAGALNARRTKTAESWRALL